MSKGDVRISAPHITSEFNKYSEVKIFDLTINRRLRGDNLFKKNRMARVKFSKQHLNWTKQDRNKVLWSDENKYSFFSSSSIKYVRRLKTKGRPSVHRKTQKWEYHGVGMFFP